MINFSHIRTFVHINEVTYVTTCMGTIVTPQVIKHDSFVVKSGYTDKAVPAKHDFNILSFCYNKLLYPNKASVNQTFFH